MCIRDSHRGPRAGGLPQGLRRLLERTRDVGLNASPPEGDVEGFAAEDTQRGEAVMLRQDPSPVLRGHLASDSDNSERRYAPSPV